jgi:hypothetical protein
MYRDVNGNEFESYEDACHYYGADTPAQVAAEEAYWAEEEAREHALKQDNDALVFDRATARWILDPNDLDMPF